MKGKLKTKTGKILMLLLMIISTLLLILWAENAFNYASGTALQNNTNNTLVLTHVTLQDATCDPACVPMTILAPGATQPYSINSAKGMIVFDYDVQKDSVTTGHLTITATAGNVFLTNGLGGSITQDGQYAKISYVPPKPVWEGRFTSLTSWTANNWKVTKSLPSWGQSNVQVIASQPGRKSPKGDPFIRIIYPAGSANYSSGLPVGGTQFYGAMLNTDQPVTLSFYLSFPKGFPFLSPTRGTTLGKLPGLYGGKGNTGTNVPTGKDGWSTRFMWCDYNPQTRQKFTGGGEVLLFSVGSNKGTFGTVYGTFLGCGVWKFLADGNWHNIQQTIHLNDIGKANGRLDVCIDGIPVFTQKNITFRTVSSLQTNGILFQTFFGGSGKEYATPIKTYADFADFALYLYPPTAPAGLCVTNP